MRLYKYTVGNMVTVSGVSLPESGYIAAETPEIALQILLDKHPGTVFKELVDLGPISIQIGQS